MEQGSNGVLSTKPAESHSFVVYTCSSVATEFKHFKPVPGHLEIIPGAVTVLDGGSTWVATSPTGKTESPLLFKDLLGKLDANVNLLTGERYYRVNTTPPSYSYSNVNPVSGDGVGKTFFMCSQGTAAPEPSSMLSK